MAVVKQRITIEARTRLLEAWHDAEVVLRVATLHESDLVAQLILDTSRELRESTPAGAERTRARCRAALDEGDLLVVLEHAAQLVGVLRADLYGDNPGSSVLYVAQVNLLPAFRSSGLGSRLLRALDTWRRGLGVDTLALDFMADNPRVAAFYQRLGFEIVGYDLIQKHGLDGAPVPSSRSSLVRSHALEDTERVIGFLRARRGFTSFEQPHCADDALAAVLNAHCDVAEARLWLVEQRGQFLGVCGARTKLSASGRQLVIASCFESDGTEACALLLAALVAWARELAAIESYVTLWEPCGDLLRIAFDQGYAVGRYKLALGS